MLEVEFAEMPHDFLIPISKINLLKLYSSKIDISLDLLEFFAF
jgi:hypothetical protein